MNIKKTNFVIKFIGLFGVLITLSACSNANDPSPWTKSESPWDQRRSSDTEVAAPTAETYKADLTMPADTASEVELSYQAESVESFAPEASAAVVLEKTAAGEVSIMDHPANYYTMQLMASVDIDRVIRFAEKNHVSTQYIVATERDGVIWHILLLDVYPDYSSAVTARDEIAPSLKTAPWIRKVGSVQKLVR